LRVVVIPLVLRTFVTIAVVIFGMILTIVLLILLDRFKVGLEVCVHINDVVTIPLLTTVRAFHGASVGRTKTDTNKCRVGNTYIIIFINVLIPMGDVVTSLEFKGVVGNPVEIHFLIILVVVASLETTGVGHDFLTKGGVGGDLHGGGGGGGDADDGGEGGKGKLHDLV
jgi:uncharacterized membrane protein YgcG